MACTLYTLTGLDGKCETSVGGIKEILIAVKDDIKEVTYETETQDGAIKPGQGKVTKVEMNTGKHFVRWTFRRNTGSFTSNIESDVAIGNQSVTTDVALQFSRAEATKRAEIQAAVNVDAVIFIHDMYDKWLLVGEENGVQVTNGTMQSGTANTDLSGFSLTLNAISQYYPRYVADTFDPTTLIASTPA